MKQQDEDREAVMRAIALLDGTSGFRQAEELLLPLAAKNNADAIFILASFGPPELDNQEFDRRHVELLTRAAKLGQRSAIYRLYMLRDTGELGDLLPEDKEAAMELLTKSFELHHRDAIYQIGVMRLFGVAPLQKDEILGRKLIEKAAELRSWFALKFLADCHAKGELGFQLNKQRSAMFDRLAIESSEPYYL